MSSGQYCYPYPRPMVTVDILIFSQDLEQVLLIKRKNEPFAESWAIPGGFIDMDETTEAAALRELFEETGVSDVAVEQFKTYSAVDRDPRGRTITILYCAKINPESATVTAGDDASAAHWWRIGAMPKLAFDHAEIIAEAFKYYSK